MTTFIRQRIWHNEQIRIAVSALTLGSVAAIGMSQIAGMLATY